MTVDPPRTPVVWLRRAALRQVLPAALRASAPLVNAAMRTGPGHPLKEWLWEHILQPYTSSQRDVPTLARTFFGASMVGTTTDFVFRHVATYGVWEPNASDWLRSCLAPGDVFIDVGANIGYYSLLAASCVGPLGKVVAVEPLPPAFAALRRNVEINEATNVRLVQRAAYDSVQTMVIRYRDPNDTAGASTEWDGDRPCEAEIAAEPLAAMLDDDELARARVVKIDVEGAEVAALRGLLLVVDRISPDAEFFIELTEATYPLLVGLLQPLGFHPYVLENPFSLSDRRARRGLRPTRFAVDAPLPLAREPVWYFVFSRRDLPGL